MAEAPVRAGAFSSRRRYARPSCFAHAGFFDLLSPCIVKCVRKFNVSIACDAVLINDVKAAIGEN